MGTFQDIDKQKKADLKISNGLDAIEGLTELTEKGDVLLSVIFLDLNMPIMNGWEFLERSNDIPNHNIGDITVYIISSPIDPRDLEKVKNFEVVSNYILKPITPKDLGSVLDTLSKH